MGRLEAQAKSSMRLKLVPLGEGLSNDLMLPELYRPLTGLSADKLADTNQPGVEALLGAYPASSKHTSCTRGKQLQLNHPQTRSVLQGTPRALLGGELIL